MCHPATAPSSVTRWRGELKKLRFCRKRRKRVAFISTYFYLLDLLVKNVENKRDGLIFDTKKLKCDHEEKYEIGGKNMNEKQAKELLKNLTYEEKIRLNELLKSLEQKRQQF